MATANLPKHIWINSIIENLYPDNSFASKSIDDSAFVNNATVHVPNAGAPSGVVVNRSEFPGSIGSRDDNDLTYDIDELTTNPIRLPEADKVVLSYDKRMSILANDRQALQKAAAENLLEKWAVIGNRTLTTGSARTAHSSSTATGNRKKITKADVQAIATKFNSKDIPAEERYLLLDSVMYQDLISDLTGTELSAFQAAADVKKGIVGQLYGFNIMQRSRVLRCKADKSALISYNGGTAAATELAVGIAWQKSCVSRAMGEVKMFSNVDDPTYYGDIYSFLVRTGGKYRRYDTQGVELLVEDTAS